MHRALLTKLKVRRLQILFQCLHLVYVSLALVGHRGILKLFLWRREAAVSINEIRLSHLIHFVKTVPSCVLLRLDLLKVVVLV